MEYWHNLAVAMGLGFIFGFCGGLGLGIWCYLSLFIWR